MPGIVEVKLVNLAERALGLYRLSRCPVFKPVRQPPGQYRREIDALGAAALFAGVVAYEAKQRARRLDVGLDVGCYGSGSDDRRPDDVGL